MNKKELKELLNLLYNVENKFNYDETKIGLTVGLIINKLQNNLKNKNYESKRISRS